MVILAVAHIVFEEWLSKNVNARYLYDTAIYPRMGFRAMTSAQLALRESMRHNLRPTNFAVMTKFNV